MNCKIIMLMTRPIPIIMQDSGSIAEMFVVFFAGNYVRGGFEVGRVA